MKLKAKFENKEDVPEAYIDLFEERGGEWVLVNIEGIKTEADVARIQRALKDEKDAHKDTKAKLTLFGDLDPDEVHKKLDGFDELQARVDAGQGGTIDEDKLDAIVVQRVNREKAPLERELTKLRESNTELETANVELSGTITKGKIETDVRKAAIDAKVVSTAIEDIIIMADRVFEVADDGVILTKDNVGTTPGVTATDWLSDMQESRPHWWPASTGGGGKGGGDQGNATGKNPWTKDNWNITAQGSVVKEHGIDRAKALASAAGSTIGATMPPMAA